MYDSLNLLVTLGIKPTDTPQAKEKLQALLDQLKTANRLGNPVYTGVTVHVVDPPIAGNNFRVRLTAYVAFEGFDALGTRPLLHAAVREVLLIWRLSPLPDPPQSET